MTDGFFTFNRILTAEDVDRAKAFYFLKEMFVYLVFSRRASGRRRQSFMRLTSTEICPLSSFWMITVLPKVTMKAELNPTDICW